MSACSRAGAGFTLTARFFGIRAFFAFAKALRTDGFAEPETFLRAGVFAMISGIIVRMHADNLDTLEPTLFYAVITPHRSLGNIGFLVLMIAFGLVSFFAGIAFLMMGAWPVFGFFGLDVVLLYLAFRINYRRAAAFEEVTVTPSTLTVRKVNHNGKAREWSLNPLWARLEKDEHEEYGISRLFLVSRGRQLTVAGFLGPDEKAGFAEALGRALGEARRGPVRTAVS
jgi:uncharacterized membrane protein